MILSSAFSHRKMIAKHTFQGLMLRNRSGPVAKTMIFGRDLLGFA